MGEGLLADDAVGLQRSAALEGDHASSELVVEDIAVLRRDGLAVELAQPLPDPLHVLAACPGVAGERAERRPFPEEDERAVPVAVHPAAPKGVGRATEAVRARMR